MVLSKNARRRLKDAVIDHDAANELADAIDQNVDYVVVTEVLTLTNAVKKDMTAEIPAGALIRSVHVNLDTAVTGDASGDDLLAKVSLGITGTIGKYGITAALTKNSKITKIPSPAVLASAETIGVYAAKTDGSACTEKFTAGTKVRVRICYEIPVALPNK